jgi:hypothetical protein
MTELTLQGWRAASGWRAISNPLEGTAVGIGILGAEGFVIGKQLF